MKIENALELDWDGLLKRRSLLDYLPGPRVAGALALVLGLFIWGALSISPLISSIGTRSLPMSEARFTQTSSTPRDLNIYSFHHVQESFGGVDLKRIREFQKGQFENLILSSTPDLLRDGLQHYLPRALEMANKYAVDPFWVLAVMWTESHFNPEATSRVDAQGLMQIMPMTGHYLVKKMSRLETEFDVKKLSGVPASKLPLQDPVVNIEMGSYYLKNLLSQFNGSHRLATVAYNMGPNGVRRRLRKNLPTGVRNLYLDKVRRAYKRLTRDYLRYLAKNDPPYKKTLVLASHLMAQPQPAKHPLASFSFKLPPVPQVKKTAFVGNHFKR